MTSEEAKSCIQTINLLRELAYNIHGLMDVVDDANCKKIVHLLELQQKCKTSESIDSVIEKLEHCVQLDFDMKNPTRYAIEDALKFLKEQLEL